MRIVLADGVPDEVLTIFLAGNVLYRPDLLHKSPTIVVAALAEIGADAVIASSPSLDASLAIYARDHDVCRVSVAVGAAPIVATDLVDDAALFKTLHVFGDDVLRAYTNAFEALEHHVTKALPDCAFTTSVLRTVGDAPRRVTLVGAGIVNLITGLVLQRAGYTIRFIDAGPDPMANAPWTAYGSSRGGDDARMFTLSEMDNYNDKVVSPHMNAIFNGNVNDLGWSLRRKDSAFGAERAWIAEYESLPVWLAMRYNADIFAFNRESGASWDKWIGADETLFAGCELRQDILRLYADPAHFAAACERQAWIGATQRVLQPDEVAAYQPALVEAVAGGQIAGAIVVKGFTVNVHKFMDRLITVMREAGAAFEWNRRARAIVFNDRGGVTGIDTDDGPIEDHELVVSPGVYAHALLSRTRCAGKINGVLGAWLRLPNIEPRLDRSLKLARRGHITEDANITVATGRSGEPLMIIGSGYGHTGIDPNNIDRALLHQIYAGLEDTAERFFPSAYEAAQAAGMLEASLKHCVRPFTATGLGLFEMLPTAAGGQCVITGGHNTGGFAQAPAIASAVLAALEGRDHPMHRLYHPDRSALFMDRLKPDVRASGGGDVDHDVLPFDRDDRRATRISAS